MYSLTEAIPHALGVFSIPFDHFQLKAGFQQKVLKSEADFEGKSFKQIREMKSKKEKRKRKYLPIHIAAERIGLLLF